VWNISPQHDSTPRLSSLNESVHRLSHSGPCCNRYAVELYSGDAWFASQRNHWLSCLKCFRFFSSRLRYIPGLYLKKPTRASFQTLCNSAFINYPISRRYTMSHKEHTKINYKDSTQRLSMIRCVKWSLLYLPKILYRHALEFTFTLHQSASTHPTPRT